MKKYYLTITAIILIFVMFAPSRPTLFAQEKEKGKIGGFEGEVSDEKEKDDDDNSDDDNEEDDTYEVNSGWGFSFFSDINAFYYSGKFLFGMLFIFPNEDSLLYDGNYRNCYFSQYPYHYADDGLFSGAIGKNFSLNLAGHYFYDESDLTGVGFRGRVSPLPYLSVEVHFTDLTEELTTRNDHLQLYNVFVNYNRLRLERWALWWGLGLKGLHGDQTYNGFAFNLGTEIYPARPLSLTLNYSGGFINNTYLPEFFGALNVHIQRFAFFVGYQYWSAGSAKIDGIIGGVKLYF